MTFKQSIILTIFCMGQQMHVQASRSLNIVVDDYSMHSNSLWNASQLLEAGKRHLANDCPAQAFTCFQNAEQRGSAMEKACAQLFIADLYVNGAGVAQNSELALYYYRLAAIQTFHLEVQQVALVALGKLIASCASAECIFLGYRSSLEYFEQAAAMIAFPAAQTEAWFHLGVMHMEGTGGVSKDYQKGRAYLELVDVQRNASRFQVVAWLWLGDIFLCGMGVTKNFPLSFSYWQQAAEQSINLSAQMKGCYRLAEMHVEGQDDNQISDEQALIYLLQAASEKQIYNDFAQAGACFLMGKLYRHGQRRRMAEKDLEKAQEYLKRAAEQRGFVGFAKEAVVLLQEIASGLGQAQPSY